MLHGEGASGAPEPLRRRPNQAADATGAVQGVAMTSILRVPDHLTRADIGLAIAALRIKQRMSVIPSTAAEIGVEIDALLDEWDAADE